MRSASLDTMASWIRSTRLVLDAHTVLHRIVLRAKALGIAEIGEALVVRMRPQHPTGVLDRAPIDLGTPSDFAEERGHAVGVGTVGAIDLLDRVQIGEVMVIEHQIVAA